MKYINVLTKTYDKGTISIVRHEWLLNECGLNTNASDCYEKSLLSLCNCIKNVNED